MTEPPNSEIREALHFRARSARKVFAIGRAGPDGEQMARRCAWCDRFYTPEDEELAMNGAKITHGICETCESRHFGEPG